MEPERNDLAHPGSHLSSWPVVFLLALALVLRLLYVLELHQASRLAVLSLDEQFFDHWAQRIAGGELLGQGLFAANPLGAYMLGGLYALIGRDLVLIRPIQMVANTVTCLFVYQFTRNLLDRRAALTALGLAALFGPMIEVSAQLVAEVWILFFAAGSLALLTRREFVPWQRILAGALFALAALGRSNLMMMAPLLPLARGLIDPDLVRRQRMKRGLSWFAGMCLVLFPVMFRNLERGDSAAVFTGQGGTQMWIGNNPAADGSFRIPPGSGLEGDQDSVGVSGVRVAGEGLERSVSPVEAGRYWRARLFSFMGEEPARFVGLLGRKLLLITNAHDIRLEHGPDWFPSQLLRWLTVGFGLLNPLALTGVFLGRHQLRKLAPVFFFAGVFTCSVLPYFVTVRYRMPLILPLFTFGGLTLTVAWSFLRERLASAPGLRPVRVVRAALVFGGALVLTYLPVQSGYPDEEGLEPEGHSPQRGPGLEPG